MKEQLLIYEDSSAQRQAFRASVPGLMARDRSTQSIYSVRDISAGGLSLEDKTDVLKPGTAMEIDVMIKDHPILVGLKSEVARRQGVIAGLRFLDLTRRQEERLDKLVLEVQKYLISKKKYGGSHIDDEHKT